MNATVKWQAQRHQHLEDAGFARKVNRSVCSVVAIVRKRPAGSGGQLSSQQARLPQQRKSEG